MIIFLDNGKKLGPFKSVVVGDDRLHADDQELPFSVIGGYTLSEDDSQAPNPAARPPAAEARAALILRIDADVDAIYAAAIGNRGPEYDVAEAEAAGYKAAGYPASPVPTSVSTWATAKGWAPTQAADDILAAAAGLGAARAAIRGARLLRKEQARAAGTFAALDAVAAQWDGFCKAIRKQLGV